MREKIGPTHKALTVSHETYEELNKLRKRMEKELGIKLSWEQFLRRWASKESK